ncbi:hypothetical protein HJC23_000850 [Cyclotella cryptica]|uniref:Uncharacterized protein n=1 Tax=Cyclotella cryptica TaxID=29204 RepID=A0ABD3PT66_9STRA|eukprot:CCRYP_011563-RA/>CCRYP_011563-RA protein AED:0.30 eAED:0.30 QI:0/-1/0/1/-1/1/1/0/648
MIKDSQFLQCKNEMAFLKTKGFGKFNARLPQKLSFPKRRAFKSVGQDTVDAATDTTDAEKTHSHQITTSTSQLQESATAVTDIASPESDVSETRCEVEATEEKLEEEERDAEEERDTVCTSVSADMTQITRPLEQNEEAISTVHENDRENLEVCLDQGMGSRLITRSQSCTMPPMSQALPCAFRMSRSLPITWKAVGALRLADIPTQFKPHVNEADAVAVPVDAIGDFENLRTNTFGSLSFSWDNGLKQSCSTMTGTVVSHSFGEELIQSNSHGTSGTTSTDVTSTYLDLAESLDDRLAEIAHHGMALVANISEGLENVNVKSLYEEAVLNANRELAQVRHDLRESANVSAKELAVGISMATELGSNDIKLKQLTEFIVSKYLLAASELASRFESATKETISRSSTPMSFRFKLLNSYIDHCNQIGNSMKKDAADLINSITEKVSEEEGCEVFETSLAHFSVKDISIRESRPIGGSKVYVKTTKNGDASIIGTHAPTPNYSQILERKVDKAIHDFAYNVSKAAEFGSEEVCKLKKISDDATMNCYHKASDTIGRINCSLKEVATRSAAEMNDHCESWKSFATEKTDEFIDRVTNTTVDEKGYEILLSTVADYSVDSIPVESRPVGGPKYYIKARKGDARIVSFVSDGR